MSMDLDKDDLAALCAGLTTDEVNRVHRLLHEWNVGPDSNFPVQSTAKSSLSRSILIRLN